MNKWLSLLFKVHVHPFLWIIMGLGLMTGHIKALLCLLLVVSVHELGHAALAVFFSWRIKRIFLLPFGGTVEVEEHGNRPLKEEFAVILARRFSMCGFRRQPGSFSCQALQVSRHLRCLPFIISLFFSSIFCRSGRLTAESSCFYTSLNKWLFKKRISSACRHRPFPRFCSAAGLCWPSPFRSAHGFCSSFSPPLYGMNTGSGIIFS